MRCHSSRMGDRHGDHRTAVDHAPADRLVVLCRDGRRLGCCRVRLDELVGPRRHLYWGGRHRRLRRPRPVVPLGPPGLRCRRPPVFTKLLPSRALRRCRGRRCAVLSRQPTARAKGATGLGDEVAFGLRDRWPWSAMTSSPRGRSARLPRCRGDAEVAARLPRLLAPCALFELSFARGDLLSLPPACRPVARRRCRARRRQPEVHPGRRAEVVAVAPRPADARAGRSPSPASRSPSPHHRP